MSVILDALKRVQDESRRRVAESRAQEAEGGTDDAMLRRLHTGARPARVESGSVSPAVWVAAAGVGVLALVMLGLWYLVPALQPARQVDQAPILADLTQGGAGTSGEQGSQGDAPRGAETASEGREGDFLGDVAADMGSGGGLDPGAAVGAVPEGGSTETSPPSRTSGESQGQDLTDLSAGVTGREGEEAPDGRSGTASRSGRGGEPGYLADGSRPAPAGDVGAADTSGGAGAASDEGRIDISSRGEPGAFERRIARDPGEDEDDSPTSARSTPSTAGGRRTTISGGGSSSQPRGSRTPARLLDPGLQAAFEQGVRYQKAGDMVAAEEAYKRALRFDSKSAQVNANLGVLYESTGQLNQAETHLRLALEADPDNAKAHNNLGVVLFRKNNYEGALLQFKQALALDPMLLDAYANMGLIYTRQGLFDQAEEAFLNALAIDPRHALSHYNLGVVYQERGDVPRAITRYRAFLNLGADDFPQLVEFLVPHLRWLESRATGGR